MKFLFFIAAISAYQVDDNFAFTNNVAGFLKTVDEFFDPVPAAEITGSIPDWISGSFYRVGPGKYEYGDDKYNHVFDPSAIIKRVHVKDKNVFFQRQFINSTHRAANVAEDRIVFAELGTWAEPPGAENMDPDELQLERCKWLVESSPTDNTIVSVIPLFGWLVAFTESNLVNLIDPFTLETKYNLDLGDSPNMPEGLTFATVLAHGAFDENGDYWTMSVAIDLPEYAFTPKTVYVVIKFKDAQNLPLGAMVDPAQILRSMEFASYLYNENPRDSSVRYFHMFAASGDFLVLPMNSMELDAIETLDSCRVGEPPMEMMQYDDSLNGYFKIFSKEKMEWFPVRFETNTDFMQLHMIQAVFDEEKNLIKLDTLQTGNADILKEFTVTNINVTGDALIEMYSKLVPYGEPVRYIFDLSEKDEPVTISVSSEKLFDDDMVNFPVYSLGGIDFPMINFNFLGKSYDHFWSVGFGNLLDDRIYHSQLSTRQRTVWREEGYSPSEPFFIPRPGSEGETDGVIISLVGPLLRDMTDLRTFLVFLEPESLTEIARAYLPEEVTISATAHGPRPKGRHL